MRRGFAQSAALPPTPRYRVRGKQPWTPYFAKALVCQGVPLVWRPKILFTSASALVEHRVAVSYPYILLNTHHDPTRSASMEARSSSSTHRTTACEQNTLTTKLDNANAIRPWPLFHNRQHIIARPSALLMKCLYQGPECSEPKLSQKVQRRLQAVRLLLRPAGGRARVLPGRDSDPLHDAVDFVLIPGPSAVPHADNVHGLHGLSWKVQGAPWARSYRYAGAASRPKYCSSVPMPRARMSAAASLPMKRRCHGS